MQLYFLRHDLAEDRDTWEGLDFDRPLTETGKGRMERIAGKIERLNLRLAAVVSSPLTRAWQTAEIVAQHLGEQVALVEDPRLSPGFGVEQLKQVLEDYPEAQALMLVGHEPDFSQTIAALIGGGEVVCKKGGLARVDLWDTQSLRGRLIWLAPPKLWAV
jgi:phosphohistidine phosphatase